MMPTTFGEFRVVADPELRFTPTGKGVASVRLVADKKKKNEQGEWVDDKIIWLTGTLWNSDNGREAENLCESVKQGDLVECRGYIYERAYETKEGEKRTSLEYNLYAIAPSLKWSTAKVVKAERQAASSQASAPAEDPWATPPASSEPPF